MDPDLIKNKLLEHFPDAVINLEDLTGGGDHWRVEIKSKKFTNLTPVQQHRLVYAALAQWMHREIHALSLQTEEA